MRAGRLSRACTGFGHMHIAAELGSFFMFLLACGILLGRVPVSNQMVDTPLLLVFVRRVIIHV